MSSDDSRKSSSGHNIAVQAITRLCKEHGKAEKHLVEIIVLDEVRPEILMRAGATAFVNKAAAHMKEQKKLNLGKENKQTIYLLNGKGVTKKMKDFF